MTGDAFGSDRLQSGGPFSASGLSASASQLQHAVPGFRLSPRHLPERSCCSQQPIGAKTVSLEVCDRICLLEHGLQHTGRERWSRTPSTRETVANHNRPSFPPLPFSDSTGQTPLQWKSSAGRWQASSVSPVCRGGLSRDPSRQDDDFAFFGSSPRPVHGCWPGAVAPDGRQRGQRLCARCGLGGWRDAHRPEHHGEVPGGLMSGRRRQVACPAPRSFQPVLFDSCV